MYFFNNLIVIFKSLIGRYIKFYRNILTCYRKNHELDINLEKKHNNLDDIHNIPTSF